MASRSALISVMNKASLAASRRMMRDFGEVENLQVSRKGAADFVSQADITAERVLREELEKARPGWGFIMEEGGQVAGDEDAPVWIIDPIDGTTNFLHGIPHFAISIAVMKADRLIAGSIYDPCRNEFYFAEAGQGAFLNNRRIRASGRRKMADGLFSTGIPFLERGTAESDALFLKELNAKCRPHQGAFCAKIADLAFVAAGRYDGYWERGLNIWDIAAGILLVKEAGGFVSDFSSRDLMLKSGDVVAANSAPHTPLLKLPRSAKD